MAAQTDTTNPSRRAALDALASIPALAILPAAASPPSTRLSALIETHRAAYVAFCATIDPLEAAEPGEETVIPGFGDKSYRAGDRYDDIVAHIDHDYAKEIGKTATISALSPALGERARAVLEARKAFCLARLDEAFAGYAIAETAYNAASAAEDDAVTAICAHRCATLEEVAIKCQYLLRDSPIKDEIQTEHYDALLGSFLSEAEGLADV
jgi:hypothetical protein